MERGEQGPAPGRPVQVAVVDLGHAGEGVGRLPDGQTVFVPGAVPGDLAEVEVTERHPRYARGRLVRVVVPSPDRAGPPCPLFGACGGCQLQHLAYPAQLAWKRRRVVEALRRLAHLPDVPVHETLGMEEPWGYRNKAQFPVGRGAGGQVVMGFFQAGTHTIVDLERCLIQDPLIDRLAQGIRALVRELAIPPYDEATGGGCLRHVVLRASRATGEAMVIYVTRSRRVPHQEELVARTRALSPEVASIWQNVNPGRTNVIFGPYLRHWWGARQLWDRIGPFSFAISPRSFLQVNSRQVEVLYRQAVAYADPQPGETLLDAYCGIGTIALFLAQRAHWVHGVEEVPEAVADAQANAAHNGVRNVTFHAGRAEEVVPRLLRQGVRLAAAVVDPPRAGCDRTLLEALAGWGVGRLAYVSCNPATFARDAAILSAAGYRLCEVQPVDMFPHTAHVELVGRFQRS